MIFLCLLFVLQKESVQFHQVIQKKAVTGVPAWEDCRKLGSSTLGNMGGSCCEEVKGGAGNIWLPPLWGKPCPSCQTAFQPRSPIEGPMKQGFIVKNFLLNICFRSPFVYCKPKASCLTQRARQVLPNLSAALLEFSRLLAAGLLSLD